MPTEASCNILLCEWNLILHSRQINMHFDEHWRIYGNASAGKKEIEIVKYMKHGFNAITLRIYDFSIKLIEYFAAFSISRFLYSNNFSLKM